MDVVRVAGIVLLAGAAGGMIADTWLLGSLFSRPRRWLEERRSGKVAELLTCSFCLRHWTTLMCLMILMQSRGWPGTESVPAYLVYWFAAVRVAVWLEMEEEIEIDSTTANAGGESQDPEGDPDSPGDR